MTQDIFDNLLFIRKILKNKSDTILADVIVLARSGFAELWTCITIEL